MADRKTTYAFVGEDKFSGVAAKVNRSADGMGKKFAKAGKFMAGGLAAAGVAAVATGVLFAKFTKDAVGDASDLSETLNKAAVIFGRNSEAIEEWASTAADSMGMTKQAAVDAASTFAIFGKAAGLAGGDLQTFSTDLTGLAADFASFYNTSPEDAITAIGAALRGESEPIRQFGILLDDATLRARALEMGLIATTKNALTPQQKALAAQAEIMAQSADAQGDFARTADGLANAQRRLKARVADVRAEFGSLFLPAAQGVTNWLNDRLLPAAEGVAEQFKGMSKALKAAAPQLKAAGGTYLPPITMSLETMVAYLPDATAMLARFGAWGAKSLRGLSVFALNAADAFLTLMAHLSVGEDRQRAFAQRDDFRRWKDNTINSLEAVGKKLDAGADALDAYGERARSVKRADLRADITDLSAKLGTAVTKLKDPELSKTRRSKIEADAAQLRDEIYDARQKLAGLGDKRIDVRVNVHFTRSGKDYYRLPSGKVVPLATGGIVTRPTVALIGEAGPEAVVPLSGPNRPQFAPAPAAPVTVQLVLDGRVIQQSIINYERTSGRPILTSA